MKYCTGRCRNKHLKLEGKGFFCPYQKSYTLDRNAGDSRGYQLCCRLSFFEHLLKWIYDLFFKDLRSLQDLRANGRVIKNRDK